MRSSRKYADPYRFSINLSCALAVIWKSKIRFSSFTLGHLCGIDRTENNILSSLSLHGLNPHMYTCVYVYVRARASPLAQETVVSPRGYFIQPHEREAQDVIARVYIGGGTMEGPSDWGRIGIEATRASPSIRRRSDTRDSNLPTTFRMHYLPSRIHTHIIWTWMVLFLPDFG